MLQTSCEINGLLHKLKYTRVNTKEGEVFKGILFLKTAFGFSYVVQKDKMILFDPAFTDQKRKDAIIKAITENSKKSPSKFQTSNR